MGKSRTPSLLRRARKAWKLRRFLRLGMKPWTKGYIEYKVREIGRVLGGGAFPSGELPPGYGFRLDERIVEYPWFFSRLPAGPGVLLDAGSILNFDFLLDHPSLKSKNLHICTLAPESDCFWQKGVSYLFDDLRRLPYRDGWFDWAVSISTLEHVGMDNTLLYTADAAKKEAQLRDHLRAVAELNRVLKPGGTLYISVPFGRAHNHGWLQIFDQSGIDAIVRAFDPASFTLDYFLYHPEGWRRSSASGAAEATFFDIHHSAGYDADFAASARAVCCLELKKSADVHPR
ncbi:MAG TPA: methyltransferase domain-containing protein [Verrucomicrobiae bacterium]|jgi:SAM-dependent methyltransferase|nr:methyltransferase domain-containing protein [Verrucomicrobiae bacterium]